MVFGATLPMVTYSTGVYAEQETARVSAAFDNLFQSLADRRVNLLAQEFDATKLPAIYEFPREFRKLRTLLGPIAGRPVPAKPVAHRPIPARVLLLRRKTRYDHDGGAHAGPGGTDRLNAPPRSADVGAPDYSIYRQGEGPGGPAGSGSRVKPAESRSGSFCPMFLATCFSRTPPPLRPAPPAPRPVSGDESCWPRRMVFLLIFIIGFIVSFVRNQEPGKPGGHCRPRDFGCSVDRPTTALAGYAEQAGNPSAVRRDLVGLPAEWRRPGACAGDCTWGIPFIPMSGGSTSSISSTCCLERRRRIWCRRFPRFPARPDPTINMGPPTIP